MRTAAVSRNRAYAENGFLADIEKLSNKLLCKWIDVWKGLEGFAPRAVWLKSQDWDTNGFKRRALIIHNLFDSTD